MRGPSFVVPVHSFVFHFPPTNTPLSSPTPPFTRVSCTTVLNIVQYCNWNDIVSTVDTRSTTTTAHRPVWAQLRRHSGRYFQTTKSPHFPRRTVPFIAFDKINQTKTKQPKQHQKTIRPPSLVSNTNLSHPIPQHPNTPRTKSPHPTTFTAPTAVGGTQRTRHTGLIGLITTAITTTITTKTTAPHHMTVEIAAEKKQQQHRSIVYHKRKKQLLKQHHHPPVRRQ